MSEQLTNDDFIKYLRNEADKFENEDKIELFNNFQIQTEQERIKNPGGDPIETGTITVTMCYMFRDREKHREFMRKVSGGPDGTY
jgi:hypothetical protein|tara:strand:- start:875 stop:1129 length:255 start_codon:yes stop_codon:yes gene_type:complete